jgi:phytoene dehydrogenase-like protein
MTQKNWAAPPGGPSEVGNDNTPPPTSFERCAQELAYSRGKISAWTELLERAEALRERIAHHFPTDSISELIEIERDAAKLRLLLNYEAFMARRARR